MTAAVIAPAIVATVIEAGKTAINESSSPLHNTSRLSKKGQKIGVCSVVKLVKEYRGQKCLFIIIHFLNDRHMREREREREEKAVGGGIRRRSKNNYNYYTIITKTNKPSSIYLHIPKVSRCAKTVSKEVKTFV
jgi:hypothetical protein